MAFTRQHKAVPDWFHISQEPHPLDTFEGLKSEHSEPSFLAGEDPNFTVQELVDMNQKLCRYARLRDGRIKGNKRKNQERRNREVVKTIHGWFP